MKSLHSATASPSDIYVKFLAVLTIQYTFFFTPLSLSFPLIPPLPSVSPPLCGPSMERSSALTTCTAEFSTSCLVMAITHTHPHTHNVRSVHSKRVAKYLLYWTVPCTTANRKPLRSVIQSGKAWKKHECFSVRFHLSRPRAKQSHRTHIMLQS